MKRSNTVYTAGFWRQVDAAILMLLAGAMWAWDAPMWSYAILIAIGTRPSRLEGRAVETTNLVNQPPPPAAQLEWAGSLAGPDGTGDETYACCPLCGGIAPGEDWPGHARDFGHGGACPYKQP